MDALEYIKNMAITEKEQDLIDNIRKQTFWLKAAYGNSFEFLKNIRVQLMTVQSKLYGESFRECCLKHLQVIDERPLDEKFIHDRLFIFLVMDENELYGPYTEEKRKLEENGR